MDYGKWTKSAIECYSRQCICTDCPTKKLLETPCRMKKCVFELLDKYGEPPQFETLNIFPDLTERQTQIIDAILQGTTTKEEIGEVVNMKPTTVTNYLNQIYPKAENAGLKFKKSSCRLPEFIEFINELKEQS